LAAALEGLQAGDTLIVRGGEYREDVRVQANPGTKDAPITVRAAPGENPVIRGLFWLTDPTWWRVHNLDVTWAEGHPSTAHMVKITGGTDWVLSGAELSYAESFAALLVAGDPARFRLTGLHVHDTQPANGTNQDHLIYLNAGMGGGVLERSVLTGSPNGRAVKIGPPDSSGTPIGNIVVRGNRMADNRGPSNIQLSGGATNVLIEGNVFDGSGPGKPNITTYRATGSGNVARNNIGAGSTGVLAPSPALRDGGGNRLATAATSSHRTVPRRSISPDVLTD
jgi:hypothetical protein